MIGVEVDGDDVWVDLVVHPSLLERDGCLSIPELGLILVRGKRKIRALCAYCPHKPARERLIERVDAERPAWICRFHDWTFDHKGRPTGPAEERLTRYPVEQIGARIRVRR